MYNAQTQITMASENCEYLCEFAKSFQIPLFVQEKGGQLVFTETKLKLDEISMRK